MPAKNVDHDAVKAALIADGWTITDDPLLLEIGDRKLYVDWGMERPTLGAEKGERRIAVEVQSFLNLSPISDFYRAVGQFLTYRAIMKFSAAGRDLYMAVPTGAMKGIWNESMGQLVREEYGIRLVEFSTNPTRILSWID